MNFNKKFLALLMGLFLVSSSAYATLDFRDSGTKVGPFHKVNFNSGCTVTANGGEAVINCVTAAITGGTIDGAVIGGVTPAAGTFTTLIATAGTIDGNIIGGTTAVAGTFTTLTGTDIISTHYLQLYVTTSAFRPASGATAGSMLALSNANGVNDCGNAGGGSTFNVCVSDGTNWLDLDVG